MINVMSTPSDASEDGRRCQSRVMTVTANVDKSFENGANGKLSPLTLFVDNPGSEPN